MVALNAKKATIVIPIDGALGEGGGQILRSALALSMITGQPVTIDNIRAKRKRPGLLRQHLTCVRAACEVSEATAIGAELGSKRLVFEPKSVRHGTYSFDVGSAGSACLVLQTVLPALLVAAGESTIQLGGGTHNSMAPSFDFLSNAFVPALQRMGADVRLELHEHGFYPAGGGHFTATITGGRKLRPLDMRCRGDLCSLQVTALSANLPRAIVERELAVVGSQLGHLTPKLVRELVESAGPGNVVGARLQFEASTSLLVEYGERGVSAERVASQLCARVVAFVKSGAAVDVYLADQLLIPCALAGGGEFTAEELSLHFETNADVVALFLPVKIEKQDSSNGCLVSVRKLLCK